MFIDAHCHIEQETYGNELPDVLSRAFDAGLTHLVAIGATRVAEGAREVLELVARDPRIFTAIGIHPHDAAAAGDDDIKFILANLAHPRVVSLGEIGLDYFYDNSPRERQQEVFTQLLAESAKAKLPVMLHVRDAHEDAWRILDEVGVPDEGGVVHCFTAGPREAKEYLDRGMYLSIPGVVTFKKAEELREAVASAPWDRLLVETDSPYLAPIPYRGKRNEPAYVVKTAERVAEIKGVTTEEAGRRCRENALRLFRMPEQPKA